MPRKLAHPNCYIIAGSNGAGKTTFATEFLPVYANCRNFINADLIAHGLSPCDHHCPILRCAPEIRGDSMRKDKDLKGDLDCLRCSRPVAADVRRLQSRADLYFRLSLVTSAATMAETTRTAICL